MMLLTHFSKMVLLTHISKKCAFNPFLKNGVLNPYLNVVFLNVFLTHYPDSRTFPILPNPNHNPGPSSRDPHVRSLFNLTLSLTLEIIIRLENELGFEKIFVS